MPKPKFKILILSLKLIPIIAFLFVFLVSGYWLLVTPIHAQCQPSDRNRGLISATEDIGSGTTFGNNEQVCITGTQDASYRAFKVPTYENLENQFYTMSQLPATIKKGTPPANLAFSGDGIYLQNGNLTVNTSSGTGVQVIFIRGNLDITGDIAYGESGSPPADDPNSGLVFIVSGNINITTAVTKINAVLISTGTICTAWSGQACLDGQTDTPQLVINGSLISLNKDGAIKLARSLNFNNLPSEKINKQAKYLYLLRGFLTRDLIITTEDESYIIPPPPGQTDGGWSGWFPAACPVACGGGTQRRSCTNPRPANGGRDCSQLDGGNDTQTCNPQACSSSCFTGNPLRISTITSIGGSCVISIN